MRFSKLKNELELLELNHKHELDLLKMKHEQAKKELLNKCNHMYEDGSSARAMRGLQWDYWYECDICNKSI